MPAARARKRPYGVSYAAGYFRAAALTGSPLCFFLRATFVLSALECSVECRGQV
jgi:hypothetical protein